VDQEKQLDEEQLQNIWNEEANKLEAGEMPADENQATEPQGFDPEPLESNQEPQAEAQPPSDPLAGLPEEVRAAIAKIPQLEQANAQLLHHVRSAEGRVASMQRELQVAKPAQQSVAPGEAPTQSQIAAASKNPEKWEQLRSDFPEWSDAIEEYVASKIGSVQQGQNLDPQAVAAFVHQQVTQTETKMARMLEEARVEGKYEGWKDTINSPDFVQWFVVQNPETQALARSPSARDAIRMLDLFHDSKKRSASDIKQERSQRLAAAATTRQGQTPPPKTLDDMSPEDLWNFEAAQREKTRAQRGY